MCHTGDRARERGGKGQFRSQLLREAQQKGEICSEEESTTFMINCQVTNHLGVWEARRITLQKLEPAKDAEML